MSVISPVANSLELCHPNVLSGSRQDPAASMTERRKIGVISYLANSTSAADTDDSVRQ